MTMKIRKFHPRKAILMLSFKMSVSQEFAEQGKVGLVR